MSDAILATQGLCRRFGGLMATNNLAIALHRGRLHAVLGPNGAGKTTLINLLSGDLRASSGSIRYKGEDITHYSADRRSRVGNLSISRFRESSIMAENRGTKLRRPIARVAGDNPPIDESDLDEPLSLAE